MKDYEVIGYSFNADMYCVECTEEYVNEQIEIGDLEPSKKLDALEQSLEEKTNLVTDLEGNSLHPIFAGDEFEYNYPCGNWEKDNHEVMVIELEEY